MKTKTSISLIVTGFIAVCFGLVFARSGDPVLSPAPRPVPESTELPDSEPFETEKTVKMLQEEIQILEKELAEVNKAAQQ